MNMRKLSSLFDKVMDGKPTVGEMRDALVDLGCIIDYKDDFVIEILDETEERVATGFPGKDKQTIREAFRMGIFNLWHNMLEKGRQMQRSAKWKITYYVGDERYEESLTCLEVDLAHALAQLRADDDVTGLVEVYLCGC